MDDYEKLLEDITDKAKLQRGCHDYFEVKTYNWVIFMKSMVIVLSALTAVLGFSDLNYLGKLLGLPAETLRFMTGLVALLVFIIAVLLEAFSLEEKHIAHRKAIENYSLFLRELKQLKAKQSEQGAEINKSIVDFNNLYMKIASEAINIRGKSYLRAKKHYYKKEKLAKQINTYPFIPLWLIFICNLNAESRHYFTGKANSEEK